MKTKIHKSKQNSTADICGCMWFSFCVFIFAFSLIPASAFGNRISSDSLDPACLLEDRLNKTNTAPNKTESNNRFELDSFVSDPELITTANSSVHDIPDSIAPPQTVPLLDPDIRPDYLGIIPINFLSEIVQKLPDTTRNITQKLSHQVNRRLWQEDVAAPKEKENNEKTDQLNQIIEQIRSIQFKPEQQKKPLITIEPKPQSEPNDTASDTTKTKEKSALLSQSISEQTLKMLEQLSKNPENTKNPFELAEILFSCGQLKMAAPFYEEALKRNKAGIINPRCSEDWVLLQIGNCLRNSEPQKAKKMYDRLIAEFHDSQWAEFAKEQKQLIDWYLENHPKKLLEKNTL